jgi:hypothetical protein
MKSKSPSRFRGVTAAPDGTLALDGSILARWRENPASFIEECLIDESTGKPFELLRAEREFLKHALATGPDGRLLYPELVYAAIKKSGKTGFAAIFTLTIILLCGGRDAEGYCCANSEEQASRVFETIRRIVEASPLLRREAKITTDRVTFSTGATITALANNYASAAGAHPVISVHDELWAASSERARRMFDELCPVPTRRISCRLVVSHAGFSGEASVLEQLYNRGMEQPLIGPDLRAGDGMLMFWSHQPIAPWQTPEWIEQMKRSLRPSQYARMIENRFVAGEENFISMASWDACVTAAGPIAGDRSLPVYAAIDASTKSDHTALVAVAWDRKAQQVRLVCHKLFEPKPEKPVDFAELEQAVLDLRGRFLLRSVHYDPWGMVASAQRLSRQGIRMIEFRPAQVTAACSTLHELLKSQNIVLYADTNMRNAAAAAVAAETMRGVRIAKGRPGDKVDLITALAMACWSAVQGQNKGAGFLALDGWRDREPEPLMQGRDVWPRNDPVAVREWLEAIARWG